MLSTAGGPRTAQGALADSADPLEAPALGGNHGANPAAGLPAKPYPDPDPAAASDAAESVVTMDAQPRSPSVAGSYVSSSAVGSGVSLLGSDRALDPYGGIAATRHALAPGSDGVTSSMAAEMEAELADLGFKAPRSESSAGGGMTLVRCSATLPRPSGLCIKTSRMWLVDGDGDLRLRLTSET